MRLQEVRLRSLRPAGIGVSLYLGDRGRMQLPVARAGLERVQPQCWRAVGAAQRFTQRRFPARRQLAVAARAARLPEPQRLVRPAENLCGAHAARGASQRVHRLGGEKALAYCHSQACRQVV